MDTKLETLENMGQLTDDRREAIDRIRTRAYEIYLKRGGRPGDGRDVEDWNKARRELGL